MRTFQPLAAPATSSPTLLQTSLRKAESGLTVEVLERVRIGPKLCQRVVGRAKARGSCKERHTQDYRQDDQKKAQM